jgi:ribosome-associated translation inhibitor RaiA
LEHKLNASPVKFIMNIEIHAPHGQLKKAIIDKVKEKLETLQYPYNKVSEVCIYFRENAGNENDKSCEIDLAASGSHITVQKKADGFEHAFEISLSELENKIKK